MTRNGGPTLLSELSASPPPQLSRESDIDGMSSETRLVHHA
jgi:hypothetical protein